MKLIGEEENHRQNLQSLVVQFEDYTTCDIALTVCAVHTMTTCWEHMLNKPEQKWTDDNGSLLRLQAVTTYTYKFAIKDNICIMHNKFQNKIQAENLGRNNTY